MASSSKTKLRRAARVRRDLKKVANGRARLSVYRSAQNIYAQVIDDVNGHTVAAASTLESDGKGGNIEAASAVGKMIAERASKVGIKDVVFDRGSYLYHGRVKALAEAAREGGLNF